MAIDGFSHEFIETNGIRISAHRAGSGTPLILLHGYPENHRCWAKVAPRLAEEFHVIALDLRGYGDSDAPADDADHTVYSKREMARDVAGVMDALGLDRAHVCGHDRGARVAYRFALDHPERLLRLGVVEILPTHDYWENWGADLALAAYHWTFLAQPALLPERMIGPNAAGYIDWTLAAWTMAKDLSPFATDALESYRTQAADPARLTAMCADYRAGATVDRRLDAEDRAAGRTIAAPTLFLAGEHGFPAKIGNGEEIWRRWAPDLTDRFIPGTGHFAPEEAPDAVLAEMRAFFSAG